MKELGTRARKMEGCHVPAQPLELPHAMLSHLLPCGVIWSLLGAGDEAACFKIDFIVTQVVGAGTDQKTAALEKKIVYPSQLPRGTRRSQAHGQGKSQSGGSGDKRSACARAFNVARAAAMRKTGA